MKKNKKIFIGIVVLIIIMICLFIKISLHTFNIKGDLTSSGAQRNYNASLMFIGNTLISGSETYYVGEGGGCTTNCEHKNRCIIINQKWVGSFFGSECKINYSNISTTRIGIERQILSKDLKPMSECGHGDLCYEIINY